MSTVKPRIPASVLQSLKTHKVLSTVSNIVLNSMLLLPCRNGSQDIKCFSKQYYSSVATQLSFVENKFSFESLEIVLFEANVNAVVHLTKNNVYCYICK